MSGLAAHCFRKNHGERDRLLEPPNISHFSLGQGAKFHNAKLSFLWREQAKSLIRPFKSIYVLGNWPNNRLLGKADPSARMYDMPTVRPSALRYILDERIGDLA